MNPRILGMIHGDLRCAFNSRREFRVWCPTSFNTHSVHRSLPSDQSGVSGDMWRLTKSANDQGTAVSGRIS